MNDSATALDDRPDYDRAAPLFIVQNEASGRDDPAELRASIEQALRASGREARFHVATDGKGLSQCIDDAVRQARASRGAVVAAGGDGTIHAVANAAWRERCTMGVLPQGTFNYFGRNHGISADGDDAVRVLIDGTSAPIQVGMLNDEIFLVNASVGLYSQLLEDREAFKQRWGRHRIVAIFSGFSTLLGPNRPMRLEMQVRDQRHSVRTLTLFVGNNSLQLRQIGALPDDVTLDGELAGVVLKPVGAWKMLSIIARGAMGQLRLADGVDMFSFRTLTARPPAWLLGPRRPVKVAMDGEITSMKPPLNFRVAPRPLWLIKAGS